MSDPLDNIPASLAAQEDEKDATALALEGYSAWQSAQPDRDSGRNLSDLVTGESPGIGRTIGRNVLGLGRSFPQIVGGAVDAINEIPDAMGDLSDTLKRNLTGGLPSVNVGFNEKGEFDIDLVAGGTEDLPPSAFHAVPDLPTTKRGDTFIEDAVRNTSRFLTGYWAAGRIKAIQGVAKAGKVGEIAAVFLRGATSDAAAMDPKQGRLSDLVQRVPALRNPITEYLSSQPGDSAAEGRFKNALEGIGLGALTDALRATVKVARTSYRARFADSAEKIALSEGDRAAAIVAKADTQVERLREVVGDVEAPLVAVKKGLPAGDRPPADLAERLARPAAQESREVFINWSRIDSSDDVKTVVQKMADAFAPEVKKAQRGVRSWEATKLSAEQVDAFDTLAKRRTGEALNAEQMTAVRELWVRSGTQLSSLARSVQNGGDEAVQIAFRKQVEVHRAVQAEVLGARTEIARALNALKIPVSGGVEGANQLQAISRIIDGETGLFELAGKLAKATPAQAEGLVAASTWAKTKDAVRQVWYAGLLSNPLTTARVAVSNFATVAQTMTTRKAANLLGRALGDERVVTGETGSGFFAAMQSIRDSLGISSTVRRAAAESADLLVKGDLDGARAAWKGTEEGWGNFYQAFATGNRGLYTGVAEVPQAGAFNPEVWGIGKSSPMGIVFRIIEGATSLPGRGLNAVDELFGGMAFRFELASRAYRQASQELASGELAQSAFKSRVAQLLAEPESVAKLSATTLAEQVSMRAQPPASSWTWQALRAVNRAGPIGKVAMPFPRTAWNVANFGMQYTPLAPMVREWRRDIAMGGAKEHEAWAKLLVGSALLSTFMDYALEGTLVGGAGGDPGLRASREAQGIAPYSIRVGDRTYSMRGLGPLSELAGMSANMADILRAQGAEDDAEAQDVFFTAALAIGQQAVSAQYMRGAADFSTLLSPTSRPDEVEQFFKTAASGVVPGVVGYASRLSDPVQREAFSMVEAFARKYQSDALAIRRDRWGRTLTYSSGLGDLYDALSPVYSKEVKPEPIDIELDRLELAVTKPDRSTSFEGVNVNLGDHPEAYARYVELAGQASLSRLNAIVTGKAPESGVYQGLTDGSEGSKAAMIESVISYERARARAQLLAEYPDLRALVDARKARKVQRLAPSGTALPF